MAANISHSPGRTKPSAKPPVEFTGERGFNHPMKAAPKASGGGTDVLSSVAGALPGKAGGLASVGGAFQKLGLSPEMVGQFVPMVSKICRINRWCWSRKYFDQRPPVGFSFTISFHAAVAPDL